MLEPFAPAVWPEVARFARRLPNYDYMKATVRWHVRERRPGGCYVWRAAGRVVAFCAINYLNPDDAWLYGMRVDRSFHGRGIGTDFTRALMKVAAGAGRSWVGLNTGNHPRHRPVFGLAERLDMSLDGVYCIDGFWAIRRRFALPRLQRHPDIFAEFANRGRKRIFHDTPGWFWSRLVPARRDWVNANGHVLKGFPVHLLRRTGPRRWLHTTANLLELPTDPRPLLAGLLGFAHGHRWLVVNYPHEWKRRVRAAWRELAPKLGRRHRYTCTERVYGRNVRPAG